jgi:sigma-54-specific transcriptional regulator
VPSAEDRLAGVFDELLRSGHRSLFHCVEETLVRSAYARARENQVQAARLLGITRNSLRTLLKRHGLIGDNAVDAADAEDFSASALAH